MPKPSYRMLASVKRKQRREFMLRGEICEAWVASNYSKTDAVLGVEFKCGKTFAAKTISMYLGSDGLKFKPSLRPCLF